jgi:multidrug resistance efflux pump
LIDLESYPFADFYGQVEFVGNLTAAETGVKTRSSKSSFSSGVERVPVSISILNPPSNLTPGMRASVNIRIYDHIKMW